VRTCIILVRTQLGVCNHRLATKRPNLILIRARHLAISLQLERVSFYTILLVQGIITGAHRARRPIRQTCEFLPPGSRSTRSPLPNTTPNHQVHTALSLLLSSLIILSNLRVRRFSTGGPES
jgi:hypothetical protein